MDFIFSNTPVVNSDHSTIEAKTSVTPPPVSGYAGVVGGNNHNPTMSHAQNDITAKTVTPSKRAQPLVTMSQNSTSDYSETGEIIIHCLFFFFRLR